MGGVLGFWGLGGDCIREDTEVGGGGSIFEGSKNRYYFSGFFSGGVLSFEFRVWAFGVE